MKNFGFRILALLVVCSSTWVFLVRGSEAKQRWVFKMKDRYEARKMLAQKRQVKRRGGVVLDDMEMQAYHS